MARALCRSFPLLAATLLYASRAPAQAPPAGASAPAPPAAEAPPTPSELDLLDVAVQLARENLQRLRRGVAFGPHVGAAALYAPSPGDLDVGVSFGIGVYTFAVPTTFDLRDQIVDLVKQRAAARLAELRAQGKAPGAADVQALVHQVFEEAKAELLGKRPRAPQTLEEPGKGLVLEGARLLRSGDWQLRLVPSIGVTSFLSLGPVISGVLARHGATMLGAEASVRLLPGDGNRSPVVDLFLRGEFPVNNRTRYDDQVSAGLRLLLDVF